MTREPICPKCTRPVDLALATCQACGAKLMPCVHCGAALLRDDKFCADCGSRQSMPPVGAGSVGAPKPTPGPAASWPSVQEQLREATAGEYDVEREIGRGGMAAVFLAREIALARQVAIKVMSPELMLGSGMVERFRQEAKTIARLSHPNIVTIHAIRERFGLHCIVMAYIEGRSLEAILGRGGGLPIPVVRSVLAQVGAALDYAHRHGVVHRDVKPANVLMDAEGRCAVGDFGIAKVAEGATLTNPGEPMGTPAYMSPEQCEGGDITAASDQYSLGVVAYEMVAGVRPFTGSPLTVMRAHVERPPPDLAALRPDCPPDLREAIARMLEKEPGRRFPSVVAAMAAMSAKPLAPNDPTREIVRELVAGAIQPPQGGHPSPPPPTPPVPSIPPPEPPEATVITPRPVPPRRSGFRWLWLSGGLAVAVVVIAWLALRNGDGDTGLEPVDGAEGSVELELAPREDLAGAIARLAPSGTLVLDTGSYAITTPLVVSQAARIVGRGRDSTRILIATVDSGIVVPEGVVSFELIGVEVQSTVEASGPALSVAAATGRIADIRLRGAGSIDEACRRRAVGVLVKGGSRLRVDRSEILGFCNAIQVTDSAAPDITGNRLASNATGIRYMDLASGRAVGNTIEENGEGVVLNAGRPSLEQNRITRNRLFGVFIDRRAEPRNLPNNQIDNNVQDIERPDR